MSRWAFSALFESQNQPKRRAQQGRPSLRGKITHLKKDYWLEKSSSPAPARQAQKHLGQCRPAQPRQMRTCRPKKDQQIHPRRACLRARTLPVGLRLTLAGIHLRKYPRPPSSLRRGCSPQPRRQLHHPSERRQGRISPEARARPGNAPASAVTTRLKETDRPRVTARLKETGRLRETDSLRVMMRRADTIHLIDMTRRGEKSRPAETPHWNIIRER